MIYFAEYTDGFPPGREKLQRLTGTAPAMESTDAPPKDGWFYRVRSELP
jgi:hypothetical protein